MLCTYYSIKNKRPSQGLIVHSDRGSQYCSYAYHVIKQHHLYHQDYKTRVVAINGIIGYIELYYNEERSAKDCFAATQDKSHARSRTRIEKGSGYRAPSQMWFDYYRQAA